MTRRQLRHLLRQQRRLLSSSARRAYAQRFTKRIQNFRPFRNSQRVALYLPHDGELDLRPLIYRAHQAGKHCYLPMLCPLGGRLWFAPYRPGDLMHFNRFQIPEPHVCGASRVRARDLDLILLPLVAFDAVGNRLGMGGGYYDQSLAFLRHRQYWHKPEVVGVGYDFQRVPRLKAQPWDIPLDAVVTEARVYCFQ